MVIESLFELLDNLMERQDKVDKIVEVLGGSENESFLSEEIHQVELLIVKAFGGNEGHYNHINSTEVFYRYEHYVGANVDYKEELIDYIKRTIENDWTDEVGITIVRA